MFRDAIGATPWLLLALPHFANAACECGYTVNKTSDVSFALYTDLMENDFLHTAGDNTTEFGWRTQEYNVSADDARGPFGKQFVLENVQTNPLKDPASWAGETENGGDPGLKLWVRGDHSHGLVGGGEMASVRNDTHFGTYRVSMKLSPESGTCGAFYWYYNNSQEIDMEFLSKQFNESQGYVNLVLQTPMSVIDGYDASNTSEFKVQRLPFRPDEKFHEYRFDWSRERVQFFVDGEFLYEMTENIPTEPGRLFMNHWSNGDPLWSAGPPGKDTPMTLTYMKAYFNSTDSERHAAYRERCPTYDASKVCEIPDQTSAPDPADGTDAAKTYFFTQAGPEEHAPGQVEFETTNGGATQSYSIALTLLSALFTCIITI